MTVQLNALDCYSNLVLEVTCSWSEKYRHWFSLFAPQMFYSIMIFGYVMIMIMINNYDFGGAALASVLFFFSSLLSFMVVCRCAESGRSHQLHHDIMIHADWAVRRDFSQNQNQNQKYFLDPRWEIACATAAPIALCGASWWDQYCTEPESSCWPPRHGRDEGHCPRWHAPTPQHQLPCG